MTFSRLLRISHHRVRSMLRKDAVDGEVARELAFHFDLLVAENLASGMTPEKARRAARTSLGNPAVLEEECRDHRGVTWFHDLGLDLVHGLRILRRSPGFTAVAAGSLALGIGANAATLGTIDALLLSGPGFPHGERLVILRTVSESTPNQRSNASMADFIAWKERSRAFDTLAMSLSVQGDLGAEGPGTFAERVPGYVFTTDMFPLLGVQPLSGRVFTEADPQFGLPGSAIVISHRLWQRRFAGDAAVLGRSVRLNGTNVSVVGVMPPEFRYPDHRAEFWGRLRANASESPARFFMVIGRLKPGVTGAQAQADLNAINAQLVREGAPHHGGWSVLVQNARDALFGWTKRPLLTVQAAVALVLILGCVNVAGLALARATARGPEIALRMALGAGRARIARQILTESLLLSCIAGGIGLGVTALALRGLMLLKAIPGLPDIPPLVIDWRILALTVLLSVATGLLFGMAPALAASQRALVGHLKNSARHAGHGPAPARLRGALVAVQIALALILLVGAGLLIHSFVRLASRDLNFDSRGLVSFDLHIPNREYVRPLGSFRGSAYFETAPPPSARIERVLDRLRALPGVASIGGVSHQMVNRLFVPRVDVVLDGRPALDGARRAAYFVVTPELFATLRTPVVRGREIAVGDTMSTQWVAVVNETMARQFWPGEDPIGKRVTLDIVPDEQPRAVVGVVRDIPVRRAEPAEPAIYTSYLQQPTRYGGPWASVLGQMRFIVRGQGDAMALVPAARRVVAEIEPDRPLANVARGEIEDYYLFSTHAYVFLLGIFACAATLLAAIGIYGVMSYAVSQRTREIGIRIALGAGAREVVALVGRQALTLVALGLAAGLAGAALLTRLLTSQLWGVSATDPPTFVAVSALLAIVALGACLVPVRRALRVDPTVALRSE